MVYSYFNRDIPKDLVIDHIDGNKLNNRAENLQLINSCQNIQKSKIRKDNKSGIKGVCFVNKTKKWQAQISINGKNKYLGSFDSPEEAKE